MLTIPESLLLFVLVFLIGTGFGKLFNRKPKDKGFDYMKGKFDGD